jgi:hypothetical protein
LLTIRCCLFSRTMFTLHMSRIDIIQGFYDLADELQAFLACYITAKQEQLARVTRQAIVDVQLAEEQQGKHIICTTRVVTIRDPIRTCRLNRTCACLHGPVSSYGRESLSGSDARRWTFRIRHVIGQTRLGEIRSSHFGICVGIKK